MAGRSHSVPRAHRGRAARRVEERIGVGQVILDLRGVPREPTEPYSCWLKRLVVECAERESLNQRALAARSEAETLDARNLPHGSNQR